MPAYNEKDNIEGVVRAWYPILKGKSENSRLVIADMDLPFQQLFQSIVNMVLLFPW